MLLPSPRPSPKRRFRRMRDLKSRLLKSLSRKPIWAISAFIVIFILISAYSYAVWSLSESREARKIAGLELKSIMDELESVSCRSTVQGTVWAADSHGYICHRKFLDYKTECCMESFPGILGNVTKVGKELLNDLKEIYPNDEEGMSFIRAPGGPVSRLRFSCTGCSPRRRCCRQYEFCVTCCLRPELAKYVQRIHARQAENDLVLQEIDTVFDFCRHACRTSSRSVIHENTYHTASSKYCFSMQESPRESKFKNDEQ